jgi:Flp pilus assembly protein TadD
VSLHTQFVIIAAFAIAIPATGQMSEQVQQVPMGYVPLTNAAGEEFERAPREGQSGGSVSLRELEQPLKGDSKKLIEEAQRLLEKGKREKLFAALEKALKDRGAAPYAYSMLGVEHLRDGKLEDARAALEVAAALMPGMAQNHHNLAIALVKLKRNQEALSEARLALQLDPGQLKYRHVLGVILLQMGREEEAEFHLQKAAAAIPEASKLLSRIHGQ